MDAASLHEIATRVNRFRLCQFSPLFSHLIFKLKPQAQSYSYKLASSFSIEAGFPSDWAYSIPCQPTTKHFLTRHDSNLPVWHASLLGTSIRIFKSQGWRMDRENQGG